MTNMKLLLLIPLVALLSGCIGVPTKEINKLVNALAKDPASLRMRIPTPWGMVELDRTSPQTNTLSHTIKDGTITVGQ